MFSKFFIFNSICGLIAKFNYPLINMKFLLSFTTKTKYYPYLCKQIKKQQYINNYSIRKIQIPNF